jgi:phosphoglycolate phosphatase
MLLELMEELAVPPDRTLMIGDTTHDLQLAANAGTPSVAVAYGAHQTAEFDAHSPLFVAMSVAELAAWLEQHA